MKRRKFNVFSCVIALIFFFLAGCASGERTATNGSGDNEIKQGETSSPSAAENEASNELPDTITFATGPVGGAYNATGSGLAALIMDKTPMRVIVQSSSEVTTWMPHLNEGKVDFGMFNGPNAGLAYVGDGGYEESKNIRMVAAGTLLHNTGYVVREDSGIESLEQLKGKRLGTGYGGNIILQKLAEANLAALGLSFNDFSQVPFPDFTAGLSALQDGSVDATMGAGPTTPKTMEVDAAIGVKVLPFANLKPEDIEAGIPEDIQAILDEYVPGVTLDVAPADVGVVKEDSVLYAYGLYIGASTHTSEAAVYEVLKTVWENYEELYSVHQWFDGWLPEHMLVKNPPAPYHDGAIKFFKEVGVWTDEHDQAHEALLAN